MIIFFDSLFVSGHLFSVCAPVVRVIVIITLTHTHPYIYIYTRYTCDTVVVVVVYSDDCHDDVCRRAPFLHVSRESLAAVAVC